MFFLHHSEPACSCDALLKEEAFIIILGPDSFPCKVEGLKTTKELARNEFFTP